MPGDPSRRPRASRGIKLVLMGVAGAALLYSCAPGVGAGLGALPYLWFLRNPFYRPPVAATPCPPGAPNCNQQATSGGSGSSSTSSGSSFGRGSTTGTTTESSRSSSGSSSATTTSQRGGFGSTGSSGSSGSS